MKVWLPIALACALALGAGTARADKLTDAEELFRRAKALMAEKKDREACPLLEESERLDPQIGTLLNLAICHENMGRIASAWGEFKAVEQRANRNDRVKMAHDRAARLEARLSRLKIVATEKPAGLVVKVDGETTGEPLWGGVAVDPGTRTIEASAPGKVTATVKADVEGEGALVTVTVPRLEDQPAPKPVVVAKLDPAIEQREIDRVAANRARRTTGVVVGASGLAVLAAGGVFGILAIGKNGDASRACPEPCVAGSSAARTADDHTDRALLFANIANVAIPVGAVAAAVGAWLFFGAGPTERRTAWLAPAPGGGSVGVRW